MFAEKVDHIFKSKWPEGTTSKTMNELFPNLSNSLTGGNTNNSTNTTTLLHGLAVQRIRKAPAGLEVLKKRILRKFTRLVGVDGYDDDRPATPSFLLRILQGLLDLADLLHVHPSLWHDFQFAVDRQTGHVYHVDLDRSYELFQNFRPSVAAYQRFLQRQPPLMACYLFQCVFEIVKTAKKFTNLTFVTLGQVTPDPDNCKDADGHPPYL